MGVVVGVCAVAAVAAIVAVVAYNRFVTQRHLIESSWSNVDTELRRRYDLVPNLVATVTGYAEHERATLEAVTHARTVAVAATGPAGEQAAIENVLVDALRQLFALSEAYPELEANRSFLDLQRQLVATEDRIQAARRLYNANVRSYNERVERVPSNVVATVFGFEREQYFEVDPVVRDAPGVALG